MDTLEACLVAGEYPLPPQIWHTPRSCCHHAVLAIAGGSDTPKTAAQPSLAAAAAAALVTFCTGGGGATLASLIAPPVVAPGPEAPAAVAGSESVNVTQREARRYVAQVLRRTPSLWHAVGAVIAAAAGPTVGNTSAAAVPSALRGVAGFVAVLRVGIDAVVQGWHSMTSRQPVASLLRPSSGQRGVVAASTQVATYRAATLGVLRVARELGVTDVPLAHLPALLDCVPPRDAAEVVVPVVSRIHVACGGAAGPVAWVQPFQRVLLRNVERTGGMWGVLRASGM